VKNFLKVHLKEVLIIKIIIVYLESAIKLF